MREKEKVKESQFEVVRFMFRNVNSIPDGNHRVEMRLFFCGCRSVGGRTSHGILNMISFVIQKG